MSSGDSSFRIYNKPSTSVATGFTSWVSQSNNWIILVLSILLILTLMDVRILNGLYYIASSIVRLFFHAVLRILIFTGFAAGSTIEVAGNLIGETGDITEAVLGSVGQTLQLGVDRIPQSINNMTFEKPFSTAPSLAFAPSPAVVTTSSDEPTVAGVKWCMVGDISAQKGCLKMNAHDKCISGRSYSSSDECIRASYA